jgi:hypothetical protein
VFIVLPSTSEVLAVIATSDDFDTALTPEGIYQLTSNTDCWVSQGSAPTAAADTDANVFVPAGGTIYLHGSDGDTVAIIRDSADGHASLAVARR